ncbi:MAG TPA: BON domain-containing protein [Candidatus Limnocylindria bacterium]|nr:BON domain-containing protein [Candidatus Limnocylindria bacterium]
MKNLFRNVAGNFLSLLFPVVVVLSMGNTVIASERTKSQPPMDAAQHQVWLTEQVRHKLAMIPWYSVFDNLEYQVDDDTVTLMGQVRRPVIKNEAESSVKSIEGVRTVVNQIEVLPPSPFDDQVRREEYRSIYSFGPLQPYALGVNPGIHIIVKGGNVTLEGVVRTQADKDAANIRARSVPGVFAVKNNLRVEKTI